MKSALLDRDLLNALEPSDVVAYVKELGWQQIDERPGRASYWRPGDKEDFELVLPLSKNLGDYFLRLSDAVTLIAEVRRATPLQIIRAIRARFEDIFRAKLKRADAGDGTVPLDDGAAAISGVADMFEAAATTAIHSTPAFQRAPQEARKFLASARLGQTEVGSYVITVHSRLPAQKDHTVPVPFERKVLMTLTSALAAANEAVTAKDRERAFKKSVERGVSANLCRALFDLGARAEVAQLEFDVDWALAEPPPPSVPRSVVFSRLAFPVLREAARYLSRIEPEEQFTLTGLVRRLEKDDPTLFDEPGSVAIFGDVHGIGRAVTVRLQTADYIEAIHAHEAGRHVTVVGTLRQDGERFRLEEPKHFGVL